MLTLFFSVSVASILTEMPGATCSHSGLAGACGGVNSGGWPVSFAIRRASRPHKDSDGRNTSVGHETKERMIGRSILAYAFFPLLEAQPIDQARVALFEMPKLRPCKANFFIGHFEESVV